jgi:hypothetical protein
LTQKSRKQVLHVEITAAGRQTEVPNGCGGWRFAHMKRSLSGRAAVVAVIEELPVICLLAVAAGSMIMIGIMLYNDWPQ